MGGLMRIHLGRLAIGFPAMNLALLCSDGWVGIGVVVTQDKRWQLGVQRRRFPIDQIISRMAASSPAW